MFKYTVKYTNYEGEERERTLYFNLNAAEIIEMDVMHNGKFVARLQQIAKSGDGKKILTEFKKIMRKAYGVKSEDGERFIKNNEVWTEFEQSEAYNEFFQKLLDGDFAAKFINGLMPKVPQDHQQKKLES